VAERPILHVAFSASCAGRRLGAAARRPHRLARTRTWRGPALCGNAQEPRRALSLAQPVHRVLPPGHARRAARRAARDRPVATHLPAGVVRSRWCDLALGIPL